MASTQFEFNVMMFGGKRTGKTSVLAAMQECFEEKFKGVGLTITPDDDNTKKLMEKKRNEMNGYFKNSSELFECKDSPTLDKAVHSFKIQIKNKKNGVIRLNFLDYPGEWINSNTHYSELAEEARKAHIIIVAIDTPYLIEQSSSEYTTIGKYNEKRNFPDSLYKLLKENFKLGSEYPKKMVLFVPLKCEKYFHAWKLSVVNNLIRSAYKNVFSYLGTENGKYCESVILPIITLGEVDFHSFKKNSSGSIELNKSGLPTTEIYKIRNKMANKAEPLYCEQPAAHVLMYILFQAKESKREEGNTLSKLCKRFKNFFQEKFLKMPTAGEFIKINEAVYKVINDPRYIHDVVNDPLNFFGGYE